MSDYVSMELVDRLNRFTKTNLLSCQSPSHAKISTRLTVISVTRTVRRIPASSQETLSAYPWSRSIILRTCRPRATDFGGRAKLDPRHLDLIRLVLAGIHAKESHMITKTGVDLTAAIPLEQCLHLRRLNLCQTDPLCLLGD